MILLGLLLVFGLAGLALVAFMDNDGLFSTSVGAVEMFGYQADLSVGEVFLIGAGAGALVLVGLFMLFGGAGRRARRRMASRRELQAQRAENLDLKRKHDSIATELAAQRAAEAGAADAEREIEAERAARDAKLAREAKLDREAEIEAEERLSTR
ncbi:hypothetical protein Cme02nite_47870 [Catellatospora methionotrophica]|uniref:Lipopolysaccharide assembly protein A domain-containing protein n=1 Tax=Catellatospora methionotrophica TaxID=121620 RepID=A0A8J3LPD8_9ACTN|nr:hypothetical protein [Catellatospora methionotrophica]GIG16455.1 hypothetical protein Cme02nite_47870 [Catellatospora methionotrophica]